MDKEQIKDLEKAAEEYADGIIDREDAFMCKTAFIAGAEWQKERIIGIIEFRITEILGDAQPNPVLRIELQGIIDKIK